MKKTIKIAATLMLITLPYWADACPMCQGGGGSKKVVHAYKSVTAFLALIPIGGMSGMLIWLKKRTK